MAPYSAAFERALRFTLEREGGYANDPQDRGGATMRGVTQAVYDGWRTATRQPRRPVRLITDDEVRRIYFGYWDDAECDVLDALGRPDSALIAFDCAINCGTGRARQLVQRALTACGFPLAEDGVWGPRTRAAIAKVGDDVLEARLLDVRAAYYRAIVAHNATQRKFLNGWMARLRWAAKECHAVITLAFARTPENGAPAERRAA